jgi:hypothetical protein
MHDKNATPETTKYPRVGQVRDADMHQFYQRCAMPGCSQRVSRAIQIENGAEPWQRETLLACSQHYGAMTQNLWRFIQRRAEAQHA